jgi:hypothetical protein
MRCANDTRRNRQRGVATPRSALFALLLSLTLAAVPSADASASAFIEAYGSGVVNGMSQFEICTTICRTGIVRGDEFAAAGAGQVSAPLGVATDSSGDVYVTDEHDSWVNEFPPARIAQRRAPDAR